MTDTCSNCRFFHDPTHSIKPMCRRFPPTLWVSPHNHKDPLFSAYPNTPPKAWCGEWKGVAEPTRVSPMDERDRRILVARASARRSMEVVE